MSDLNSLRSHLSTELMSLALDDMLEPAEEHQFAAHLQTCPACRMRWAKWQCISDLLQLAPFAGPAPGFVLRVDERIQARQRRRERMLGGLVLVGGTVSIWSILFLGLVLTTAAWLVTTPGARIQGLEFIVFGGQLVALTLSHLSAVRDAVLGLVPAPALMLMMGICLMGAAVLWARLVPASVLRPAGPFDRRGLPNDDQQ